MTSDDAVPLQFKYEAADCRLYYTLDNIYNMTRQWRDVAAAIWDDPSMCVEGSTGFSTTGKTTPNQDPQETSPEPTYDSILRDDYQPPADSDILSSLEFDSAPFSDGPGSTTKLYKCSATDEGTYCRGSTRRMCVNVRVTCDEEKWFGSNEVSEKSVYLCLPSCSDTPDCGGFQIETGSLYCDGYVTAEQKRRYHIHSSADESDLKDAYYWQKVCIPLRGTDKMCE